jgi:hypothetical protein
MPRPKASGYVESQRTKVFCFFFSKKKIFSALPKAQPNATVRPA